MRAELLLIGSGGLMLVAGVASLSASIRNHIDLFHLEVMSLPAGRGFCRRNKAAVDDYELSHVGRQILGSGQPDRFLMFAFQAVFAAIRSKATLDGSVSLVRGTCHRGGL